MQTSLVSESPATSPIGGRGGDPAGLTQQTQKDVCHQAFLLDTFSQSFRQCQPDQACRIGRVSRDPRAMFASFRTMTGQRGGAADADGFGGSCR